MGAHGSKEKLSRTASERYVHSKIIEQERFGRFGKRGRGSSLSARKRNEQNGNIQNDFKVDRGAGNVTKLAAATATVKPIALHKRYSPNNTIQSTTSTTSLPPSEKRVAITPTNKQSTLRSNKRVNQKQNVTLGIASAITNKTDAHSKEHNHLSQQSPPQSPTLNNNTIESVNNNHITAKNQTNSPKLQANGEKLQQQQPVSNPIHHRNGKSSTTEATNSMPKQQTKQPRPNSSSKSSLSSALKSVNNGELNENLSKALSSGNCSDMNDTTNYDTLSTTILPTNRPTQNLMKQKQHEPSIESSLNHSNNGIVAMSILIEHLTFNLKAFETPSLRAALETTKVNLQEAKTKLDSMQSKCVNLEEQAIENENFYAARVKELKEFNELESERVKLCLYETEKTAKDQIQSLQFQLSKTSQNHEQILKACQIKAENRCYELEAQLQLSNDRENELLERLNNSSSTENQLRDKVQETEQEFAERLQASITRERELNDKLSQAMLKAQKAEDERCESDKQLKLLQDEIFVLRQRRDSSGGCAMNGMAEKNTTFGTKSQMLEEEVESLRSVLELKQNEIAELRKQNHEYKNAHDELPKALIKMSVLESRLEELTIQYQVKTEEEKDLTIKNRSLQDSYQQEIKNRTRLALHNEELQWKLKQNSEKFSTALNELSKSYQDRQHFLTDCKNSLYGSHAEASHVLSADKTLYMQQTSENGSPPSSPVIKGVVEKSDSVSYVLEINDDESAEAMANRIVKRAGSFRVNFTKEKSPSFKRQYSVGANSLSQSASATSILRQHSDSPCKSMSTPSPKQTKSARIRSNSLCTNNESKKVLRSPTSSMPADYKKWQESLQSTSSPHTARNKHSPDSNDMFENFDYAEIGRAAALPTNDAKSPHSSMRYTNLCASLLPNHNSTDIPKETKDVYKLEKCQQIKESAGEAMVSSVNSEESFGSGSDVDSMSSSNVTSPSHSDTNKHNCHQMTIDEEALMNKIVASLSSTRSTPMEVSWCEDIDNERYTHESSA